MTTLTDFLLARIAEDEAVARAAILEIENGRWVPGAQPSTTDIEPLYVDPDGYGVHVAASPARVLAECEAKRRIVALHRPDGGDEDFPLCRRCHDSGPEAQGYPCDTLRELATVYASHPDYDESWRP